MTGKTVISIVKIVFNKSILNGGIERNSSIPLSFLFTSERDLYWFSPAERNTPAVNGSRGLLLQHPGILIHCSTIYEVLKSIPQFQLRAARVERPRSDFHNRKVLHIAQTFSQKFTYRNKLVLAPCSFTTWKVINELEYVSCGC